jgi:protein dithiol oxidoreductase (disulfide-forming)
MNQRRATLVALLGLGLIGAGAARALEPGKDYMVIKNAAPSQNGPKIEVIEAFSYMCPHCHDFEPQVKAWVKKLPADVVYRRLPVVFRDTWAPVARAFYTLEAMGQLDKVHDKIFEAIHKQNVDLSSEGNVFQWIAKQGIDQKKFIETYKSFGITSKVNRGNQLARGYNIGGVPALIVEGKYQTSASQVGGYDKMLAVADELIMLGRVERKLASEDGAKRK